MRRGSGKLRFPRAGRQQVSLNGRALENRGLPICLRSVATNRSTLGVFPKSGSDLIGVNDRKKHPEMGAFCFCYLQLTMSHVMCYHFAGSTLTPFNCRRICDDVSSDLVCSDLGTFFCGRTTSFSSVLPRKKSSPVARHGIAHLHGTHNNRQGYFC